MPKARKIQQIMERVPLSLDEGTLIIFYPILQPLDLGQIVIAVSLIF